MSETVERAKQSIEKAHQMVSDLCHQKRKWVISIPARPDYDPDLVIGQALRDAETAIDELASVVQPA